MPVARRPGSADRTVEYAWAALIGRTEHRSGTIAALHWYRTPATGALIFPGSLGGNREDRSLRSRSYDRDQQQRRARPNVQVSFPRGADAGRLFPRRGHRHHRALDLPGPDGEPGTVGGRGESPGREQPDRRGAGRQERARRPYAADDVADAHDLADDREADLPRSGEGLRGGSAVRHEPAGPGGPSVAAGALAEGADRACPGAARRDE